MMRELDISTHKNFSYGSRATLHSRGQSVAGVSSAGSWLCLVACIFMAYALFAVYIFTQKTTLKIEVPISFFLPYGMHQISTEINTVIVEIYGKKEYISQVDKNDLLAYVDMSTQHGSGEYHIFLRKKNQLLDQRSLAFGMSPHKVRIEYEDQKGKLAKGPVRGKFRHILKNPMRS
ncbi:MAG: hypothetical protein ACRCVN_01765 [Spirochaetia bacterium]